MGGSTREMGDFLFTSTECLRGETSGGGEYGTFFMDEERRAMHHAIELLRQAGVEISIPNIQKFISGAALSLDQRNAETWRDGFHNETLRKAFEKQKTPAEQHDYEIANQFWAGEWVVMAEKTRSCVLAGMLNKLFPFNTGICRELVSTHTTCSPLDLLRGRSILINCPSSEYGDAGKLIGTAWKHLVQKCILARSYKPGDFYNVIWADEAWQVVTSFDQHYAATSRSHGGAMVYLAQSRDSFYSALKGDNGRHYADTLMGMFHHKIFHAVGSAEDAQYASSLLGVRLETTYGGSSTPPEDSFDSVFGGFFGKNNVTTSYSESYQPVLQPKVFMNGLRCGGQANNGLVDAIVIRSGEPFSSGENYLFTTFKQR